MSDNIKLGKYGEERAAVYLDRKGYEILARNYRCRYGEIDIIAMDGDTLCFIEVKTRRNLHCGLPCESVTFRKAQHLKKCAYTYLQRFHGSCEGIRMEIVEVLCGKDGVHIRHLQEGFPQGGVARVR